MIPWLLGCAHPAIEPRFVAHRGVHQPFDPAGVDGTSCTAQRIDPPTHEWLENTLPSMGAAFDAGAERVELDVHATADGELVVFHDATLECRTDGHGRPEDHTLAELRGLDLGYGYTADGGATYPLRGAGVGLWVTLPEVFAAFPDHAFVIHVKAGGAPVGTAVADVLGTVPLGQRSTQWVYGDPEAVAVVAQRWPELQGFSSGQVRACLSRWLVTGWFGGVPKACRDTVVMVPLGVGWVLPGWPRRFVNRMNRNHTDVVLMGPVVDGNTTGIDDADTLARVPRRYHGWVWTDRIEVTGR
ncbi:MAG: glycerophosphodiester phosphodiesterase family protein [Myxococcota bacterium]